MICTWYFKIVSNFTLLTVREITYNISKYHSWYLCQIPLQIMLLPKPIDIAAVVFFFRRPLHKKTCANLSIIVNHPIIFIFITLANHSHKTSVVNARFPFTKTSRKLRRKEAIRVKNLFHSFPSLRDQPGMEHAFSTKKFPTGKPRAILIKIHSFPGIF